MNGRIISLLMGLNRKQVLTVELDDDFRGQYDKLKDLALDISIKKATKKRGLTANAYYWSLLGKLAESLKISNSKCHNMMLRRYGVVESFDEKVAFLVLPDTDDAERQVDESDTYHLKPTSQVREGKDGKMYRTYLLMKGSSSFDTAEMARLISGIRDECRNVGIPYETTDEIANLISLMEGIT